MRNNGYFMTFWLFIWNNLIKNSFLYRILCGIYAFISDAWKKSIITNRFRRTFFAENSAALSLFGRILFSPFTFIEFLNRKFGETLDSQKDKSIVVRTCKYYLHNILALNFRFIGVFAFCASVVALAAAFIRGGKTIPLIICAVVSIVFSIFDINLTDALRGSIFVRLIEKCLGLKLSFNFYYLTKCEGNRRFICAALFGALTGMICAAASPIYAILFAGGLWFVFMVLYKTEFGVFSALFLAPLIPTMALVGLSLLCLVSLIIRALTTKKFEFRRGGVGLMVIGMLVVYLIASITSFSMIKSLSIWAVYFAFMTFFFVVVNTINTRERLMDLLTVFVLSGVVVCVYGLMQYVFGWNTAQSWMDEEMFEDIKMRIYSTLENPNVLGEYILLVLPVCIGLLWTKKGAAAKVVYGVFSGIIGIALILTFSRGCWLGIMLSAAVFVTFAAGKLWGLALIALPVLPLILPESIINRFTSIGDMKDSSTSYRVYIWMGTLLMLRDFWLTGIGPGTEAFTQVYPFYSYSSIVAPHSHNLFLQIITESGIIGIGVFLLLIYLFVRRLTVACQTEGKGGSLFTMIVALGAGIAGFLLQGMFDNCFYNYRVFMIFWAVIAIGVSAANIAKSEKKSLEVKKNA